MLADNEILDPRIGDTLIKEGGGKAAKSGIMGVPGGQHQAKTLSHEYMPDDWSLYSLTTT